MFFKKKDDENFSVLPLHGSNESVQLPRMTVSTLFYTGGFFAGPIGFFVINPNNQLEFESILFRNNSLKISCC